MVKFSPVVPIPMGCPSRSRARMAFREKSDTARSGPPWYLRSRCRSPATPPSVTAASATDVLGTPPPETLMEARRPGGMARDP